AGPRQIDWKALRRTLNQSRLTMAKPEEVLAVTGYEIGAVSPFGLPQPIRTLVDESVLAQEEVSIGSGVRSTTVILKTADLMQALGDVEVVQLN
ncbi:MAG TPA: YbaK/EbsC family protein, partial [Chloroflexota bacterium]|nr:YbaK/EbsC family protein [Chloroflexota bacterium]